MKSDSCIRLIAAGLLSWLALGWLPGCGLDEKVNELINPPAEKIRPVAIVTVDSETVKVKTQVTLNGAASYDPQNSALTYAWSLLEKPGNSAAALSTAADPVTTFVADKGGYYTATLQVTDAKGNVSDVVYVRIDAVGTGSNHPPVANAGADVSAKVGEVAVLNGTASYDADQNELTYLWSLKSAPSGSSVAVSSPRTANAYLYPDVAGTYTIRLWVSDGVDTDEDFVVVTAASGA